MGKAAKVVIGIALIASGAGAFGVVSYGGLASFAIGSASFTYASIVSMIGLSVLGSALAPDLGDMFGADAYAGGIKLQTQRSNTSAVPTLYGYNRIAGNIVYQTTNDEWSTPSDASGYNRNYWALICLCSHECEDVQRSYGGYTSGITDISGMKCLIGSEEMVTEATTSQGNWDDNFTGTWSSTKNVTDVFTGDGGYIRQAFVTPPRTYQGQNIYDNVAWKVHNRPTGGTSNYFEYGSGLNIGDTQTLPDGTYMAVHQIYDSKENRNTQLQNIVIEMKGKLMRTISVYDDVSYVGSVTEYSANPANIVMDMMENGLEINAQLGGTFVPYQGYHSVNNYDLDSFNTAQNILNARGWSCNLAIMVQSNIQSHINDVLATCRGQIVHSNGKWKMIVDDKNQTSIATLSEDSIINNSLSVSMKGSSELANKINPNDEWLSAQVEIEDTDLQTLDGQTLIKTLDIKGCTNTAQAEVLAEIALNSMRYSEATDGTRIKQTPLSVSFATTVKNAHLEVGDVISIDHDLLDRVRKFVILSVETDQSGLIQIVAREYCETHYKDASGTYII